MKSEVLKRAMFVTPLSKAARNSGIMEGFEDDELESEVDRGVEELPPMARTPQNPEILMNNLRGDMRSVNSRYQELAEMVGEDAAMETPPEVLAILQPVLAAQQQGIAALGAGPGMPPGMPPGPEAGGAMPPGMPPGMPPEMAAAGAMPPGPGPAAGGGIAALPMPPEMAPPMQPPAQGFAKGGMVQHFENGSGPEGVTQSAAMYPPELVTAAHQYAQKMLTAQPRAIPDLRTTMESRMPLYQDLLGTGRSKEDMQTQMLLDIASRGLAFAGNVDEQGRPLTGSFASRLGQVTRTMPNTVMGLLAEQRKGEMATKQLALQAAEKEISEVRELNAKDIDKQQRFFIDIIKEQAKAQGQSPIGKGDWAMAVVTRPGFISAWGEGKTTADQDNLMEAAITKLKTPRLEYQQRINPTNNQPYMVTVEVPAVVPPFVLEAEKLRARRLPGGAPTAALPARTSAAGAPAAGAAAPAVGATTAPVAAGAATLTEEGPRPGEGPYPPEVAPTTYSTTDPTMFNLAAAGTGPIPVAKTFISRVPIVGNLVDADQNIQANTFLDNAVNQLNKSLATNPRFAEGERKQIMQELQLATRVIDRPEAYQQRLIGLDTLLTDLRSKAYRAGYQNPNLGPDTIKENRAKVGEIDEIRNLIGVPPRVSTKSEFDLLPPGSPYILNGQLLMKRPAAQ